MTKRNPVMVFDSIHEPIPILRTDLEIIPYEENGEQLLIMRDPAGYGGEMVVFKPEAWALFSLFDGKQTIAELQREIFRSTEVHVDAGQILQIIRMLDEYFFLQSQRFFEKKQAADAEFLNAETRPAVHAGQSYPDDPDELRAFLDALFEADTTPLPETPPIGIITPHIDLRVGPNVYVPPFRQLAARKDIDTVVIFGTSHYSTDGPFIPSRKHLETPLGLLQTDTDFVDLLHERTENAFTRNDIAHKPEHSIEFPAIFIKYLFGDAVKVVPILVTSFDECIHTGTRPSHMPGYAGFMAGFLETLDESGRNVAYVLSVDWSHIGAKFGDEKPASELLEATRQSDMAQLDALQRGDYEAFWKLLVESKNATRIDGFSCLTAFFDIVTPERGALLLYDQWHEEERQSGVTYAGMSFFNSLRESVD